MDARISVQYLGWIEEPFEMTLTRDGKEKTIITSDVDCSLVVAHDLLARRQTIDSPPESPVVIERIECSIATETDVPLQVHHRGK